MNKILVPLDGSARAEAVLTQLRRLIDQPDTELVLVEAFSVPPVDVEYLHLIEHVRQETDRYLKDVELRMGAIGTQVRRVLIEGPAAETILEVAAREKPTLIAMSTHGRSGVSRFVFGSVAEKVLRHSDCPVLAVRSFADGKPVEPKELKLSRVIIPIDGSNTSVQVVPVVGRLLKRLDAKAFLVHVTEEPAPHWTPPEVPLAKATHLLGEACIPATHEIRTGDPADQILRTCRERGGDLIAMTTHGRTGLTRWVLGSVTEKVLRGSETPVLVVRAGKEGT